MKSPIIYLADKAEILEELVIIPRLGTKEIKVGSVKKKQSKAAFSTNASAPWSFGRYFPFEKSFLKPHL